MKLATNNVPMFTERGRMQFDGIIFIRDGPTFKAATVMLSAFAFI
jgi:hypothetical protein